MFKFFIYIFSSMTSNIKFEIIFLILNASILLLINLVSIKIFVMAMKFSSLINSNSFPLVSIWDIALSNI